MSDSHHWSTYDVSALPDYSDGALAGWSSRWRATALDMVFALVFLVPGAMVFVMGLRSGPDGLCVRVNGSLFRCRQADPTQVKAGAVLFLGAAILYGLQYCVLTGRTGQSWGRRLMGYKIVDSSTYKPIGAWQVFRHQLVGGFADDFSTAGSWPRWPWPNRRAASTVEEPPAIVAVYVESKGV